MLRALALALILLAPAFGAGLQSPVAGGSQSLQWPASAQLQGQILSPSPVEWWSADGNDLTENHFLRISDAAPLAAVGPMRDALGNVYGWPGDLQRVGGLVYGVDVAQRHLYTLDVASGACTPVGPKFPSAYSGVQSLAYDRIHDLMFAVDLQLRQLIRIDRSSGQITNIGSSSLLPYYLIRALAYRESDGMLYAFDYYHSVLLRIDPATGARVVVASVAANPIWRIDELEFVEDRLYAARMELVGGVPEKGQLVLLDMQTGGMTPVGPLEAGVSTHALLIHSLPEWPRWSQIAGPGIARFEDPDSAATTASFSLPGTYELGFSAVGVWSQVTDSLMVDVVAGDVYSFCPGDGSGAECPCANPGAAGEGCRNSTGAGALLQHSGSTSVALDDGALHLSGLPQLQLAIVYAGAGPQQLGVGTPFGDGLRCVSGALLRYPVKSSGAGGSTVTGQLVQHSAGLIAPGSTWWFQGWYRDGTGPCGAGANLSNGVAITFGP